VLSFANQVSDYPALLANREILHSQPADHIRGKRDRASLALLIGCGPRRAALVGLRDWDFMWLLKFCPGCMRSIFELISLLSN
jgi:hypothetical protein